MKEDKKRKTMQETLSSLDAVLASLDAYPNLEDALLETAQGQMNKYMGQLFPTQLDFAKDILEHLVGTDALIEIVAKFLTVALPGVEVGVKSALLANMQNLGANCTIDPIIYEKAVKEGILFDLRQIDLYDKLTVSPLDKKIGQYFYFGVEDCESSYDVLQTAISPNNQTQKQKENYKNKKKTDKNGKKLKEKEGTSYLNRTLSDSVGHYFGFRKRDFDTLLWYMKNKGVTRQVWGKRTSESEDIFNGDESNLSDWVDKKGSSNTLYYRITNGTTLSFYAKKKAGKTIPFPVPSAGEMVVMDTNKRYIFQENTALFCYEYGNPKISKLSQDKIYVTEKGNDAYRVFYFDGTKWASNEYTLPNYESIEKIPVAENKDNLEKDHFIVIDKSVYQIKENATFKKVTDKDGNETEVIDSLKTRETINITNDVNEDLSLFIDYKEKVGEKTKGQMIKEGETPQSTFSDWITNLGSRKWIKSKIDRKDIKEGDDFTVFDEKGSPNGYYSDNDGDGKYTEGVDKIYILPYASALGENGVETYYGVNVNEIYEKRNKYTKDFGVLTLEYSPRTGNLLQSDGKPMQQQTPYDNVLHVFFGNVKELTNSEYKQAEDAWMNSSRANKFGQQLLKSVDKMMKAHKTAWKEKQDIFADNVEKKAWSDLLFLNAYTFYNLLVNGGSTGTETYINVLPMTDNFKDIEILEPRINSLIDIVGKFDKNIYSELNNQNLNTDDLHNVPLRKNVDNGLDTTWSEFNYESFCEFEAKIKEALQVYDDNNKKIEGQYYTISSFVNRVKQLMNKNESLCYLRANGFTYPEAVKNYYLKKTLFEFNADYINSIQLFDPKVLTAQLITSLFGSATIGLMVGATASWKTDLIRDIVKDMVEKQIAAEDFAVSDCFFTFTNDAYNGMLRAADLRQAGLYSQHGEENGNNAIDPAKMLEGLNEISNCADQAGQTDVIKGVIMNAAVEVSKDVYKENEYLAVNTQFGLNMSFIDALMINLCTQMVMAILSPKVYLLILINLELFGMDTNFDLKSFIERFESLIRSIIKSNVDPFMQHLTQEIKKIVGDLTQKLTKKLANEQVEMYARLIKQILMHLRMLTSCGNSIGWTQDVPEYADIVASESSQEPIDEC